MRFILAVAIWLGFSGSAFSQKPPTLADFLHDPTIHNVAMSPSGEAIAGVRLENGLDFLVIVNFAKGEPDITVTNLNGHYVEWLEWANDSQVLMTVRVTVDLYKKELITEPELRQLEARERGKRRTLVDRRAFRKIVRFDVNTGEQSYLLSDHRDFDDSGVVPKIVDLASADPDHIIVSYGKLMTFTRERRLLKANIYDGTYEILDTGNAYTDTWYTSDEGIPLVRIDKNRRGDVQYILIKPNEGLSWEKVRTYRSKQDDDVRTSSTPFKIVAPGPLSGTFYYLDRPEGADTIGLYLFDVSDPDKSELVKAFDGYDVSDALLGFNSNEVIGLVYHNQRRRMTFFDENLEAKFELLSQQMNEDVDLTPIDASRDNSKFLIFAQGPTDAGSYLVWDSVDNELFKFASARRELSYAKLAPVDVFEYIAQDGTPLFGYITRPVGQTSINSPLIVMPHGGPEVRDYYGYDEAAQILAARGYMVFQPNFRGSGGFGLKSAQSGHGEWGASMQTDVYDGVDALVFAGLTHPKNMCIFGASYGGYTALAAAAFAPERFACVIATAAPSDLPRMLKYEQGLYGSRSEEYKYWKQHMALGKNALKHVSPYYHTDQIIAPVLVIHGEEDDVVPVKQSNALVKALKRSKVDYKYLRLEHAGHSFRNIEDEATEWTAILSFLSEHLPVE